MNIPGLMQMMQRQPLSPREVVAQHELSQAMNRGGNEEHTMAAIKRLPQGALASLLQNREPIHDLETRAMASRQKLHDPFSMG